MRIYSLIFCCLLVLYSCTPTSQEEQTENTSLDENLKANSLDYWDDLISKDPENGNYYHQRALLHFQLGNGEMAVKDIKKAVKYAPQAATFYVSKGKIHAAMIDMELALESFEKALEIDSTEAEAFLGIGKIYYLVKNPDKAMKNINQGLKLNPYMQEAYFIKGQIYKDYNDLRSAVSSFQTAIEQDPDYYDAYVELGILYAAVKDPICIEYFNSALRIDSMGTDAYYAKAKYYQDIDSIEDAFSIYEFILSDVDSLFSLAYFNKGYVYMIKKQMYDSALFYFEQAVTVDPGYYQAHHNIGVILEFNGDKNEAEKSYKNALKINKNYELSREALQNLYK